MDTSILARDIVAILAPALPFLAGTQQGSTTQAGSETIPDAVKKIWSLLWSKAGTSPATVAALRDVATHPSDADARVALQLQLGKLLADDASLADALSAAVADTQRTSADVTGADVTRGGEGSVTVRGIVTGGPLVDDYASLAQQGKTDTAVSKELEMGDIANARTGDGESQSAGTGTGNGQDRGQHAEPPASPPEAMLEEQIRLDVGSPDTVEMNRTFEVAVRVSQPNSSPLNEESLTKVTSRPGRVYVKPGEQSVRYRVGVSAADCTVHTPEQEFLLYPGQDSEVVYFQLTPLHAGVVTIIVSAYQPDNLLAASARIQITVATQVTSSQPQMMSVSSDAAGAVDVVGSPADTLKLKIYAALSGDAFTLDDLEDLCFRLNVDWDDLSGDNKPKKARALVLDFAKRDQLAALRSTVLDMRPNLTGL